MDVFDLAAKISLDTSGFESGLDKAKSKFSAFGSVFKANIASDMVTKGFSAITSGISKAGNGLMGFVKQSQAAYGEYEQMVGGVDKLYQSASGKIQQFAKGAYATSQMSANEYMNIATQFSASLINSLGGDVNKAADQTDVAMRAISDNVNVFGSNMEDVTNAFKGFSKQNYTMLDNLKLGYGGTKTEMERLIKDANEYAKSIGMASNLSINSFSDVVTAIELIQKKQHIAGTTAKEATKTLQGSQAMLASAWQNLVTMIGTGEDITEPINNVVDSLVGRAATAEDVLVGTADKVGEHVNGYLDNLLPTVERVLGGLGTVISKVGPMLAEKLPSILDSLIPPIVTSVSTLAATVIESIPGLVKSIENALQESFGDVDLNAVIEKVSDVMSGLADAINQVLPDIINVGADIVTAIIQGITNNADKILEGAASIVGAIGNGIIQNLPVLMTCVTELLNTLISYLTGNMDTILNGAMAIVTTIGDGIIANLPLLVNAAVQFLQTFTQYISENKEQIQSGIEALVTALVEGIVTLTPELADAALAIVTALGGGLIQSIPEIVEALPEFVSELFGAITDAFNNASSEEKIALAAIIGPILTGGIKDAVSNVKNAKDMVGAGADILKKIFSKGGASKATEAFDEGADFLGIGQDWTDALPDTEKISTLDKLKDSLAGVKEGLAGIGGKALDGLKTFGTFLTGTVGPAIVGFLPTLVSFLPVIIGITAAIAGVIIVIKNWDKISKALQAGWETLKNVATAVWTAITKVIGDAWKGIKSHVKEGAEKVKNVVGGAWDKVKTATTEKWQKIKDTVKENGGGIKGVLKTAVKGYLKPWKDGFEKLNKATGGKLGEAVDLIKKKAGDILNGIKEKFTGIGEIGRNLVTGLWNGINDKVNWVVEKVKGFGDKVLKGLKDFFGIHSPSKVMETQVGRNLALGVANGITKNTKYAKKSAEDLGKIIVEKAQKKLEKYETYHTLSLANEVAYWDKIRKTVKKGTEARYEADKEYLSKKKELQEQEKSASDTLKSSLASAEETYQNAIDATLDKLNQRKDSILSAFSLFEKFDAGDAVNKNDLMTGLNSQVEALSTWESQIAALKSKLGDTDLFEAIQEKGVSSLNDVIALNSMTQTELDAYAAQYDKLQSLADKQAHTELDATIASDQQTALNDYMKSVSDALKVYTDSMSDLGMKVKKLPKSVKSSMKRVGKNYTSVLESMNLSTSEKMTQISGTLEQSLKKMSKKSKKYGADLVDNFIKGIESKEGDLSNAVVEKIAKKVKKYIGFSEPEAGPLSDFHKYAPDMIDLFVNGIEKNGQRIGRAFDDSLGLDDVSSRISDTMTIPAVQPIGNALNIAGLPQLTEINGTNQSSATGTPQTLNITMQVDKTAFARIIYQLNRAETQRVGVSLATGTI